MSQYQNNPYSSQTADYGTNNIAAAALEADRVRFIRNTYLHLAGAIFAFVMIELILFNLFPGVVAKLTQLMVGGPYNWMIVLGAFMAVSYVAEKWAMSGASVGMQYAGLGTYVVGKALIFVPLLAFATSGPAAEGALQSAAIVTLVIFAGLSVIVLVSKADFSFMRYALYLGGLAAMAAIVVSIFTGGTMLGAWFTWAMIVLACGYILYHTSNILHHYRTDQHVSAALALFSSVALLFWYILQLFMSRD